MKNKKILPYIIFGVPVVIGLFFVYKAIKNRKKDGESDAINTPEINTNTTTAPAPITYTSKEKLPFKKGDMSITYIGGIQKRLGLVEDGKFGSQTQASVIKFQKENNLVADGIVGAKTWKALFFRDFPSMDTIGGKPLVYEPTPIVKTGSVFGSNPFN